MKKYKNELDFSLGLNFQEQGFEPGGNDQGAVEKDETANRVEQATGALLQMGNVLSFESLLVYIFGELEFSRGALRGTLNCKLISPRVFLISSNQRQVLLLLF